MVRTARRIAHSLSIVATLIGATTMLEGEASHRVKATFLNQESSLRTSISNRDEYLLRVIPRRGTPFDAIAVDNYPGYAEALPLNAITKDVTFSVKLVRTPYCDRPGVSNGQESIIRCFSIERGSVKMPKNATSNTWWK